MFKPPISPSVFSRAMGAMWEGMDPFVTYAYFDDWEIV
jgi:hypothetical protein